MKKIQLTIYTALISAVILISCKKETKITSLTPPAPIDTSSCVTGRGVNNGDIIPGQYIVAYNSGTVNKGSSPSTMLRSSQGVLARNDIAETQLKQVFGGEPAGFVVQLNDEEVARLNDDPAIKLVEHDRVISLGGCFTIAEPRLLTWNIKRVGYGDGRGKTAWIIDTGIDIDHPDLNVDAARSRSFLSGVTSPDDGNGHGTHVAGIIGGLNNNFGITGVASGATLVALRVLDADGKGTVSSIIEALAYVNANGAAGDVVNLSLSEDQGISLTLNQQVINTASRGIYFAIAAGNDAQPANKYSPANVNAPNVYTVSAIDSLDRFASFSNYGNDVVDLAAPGVHILSSYSQGRYGYLSGTSMAAPHVAGLLLLKGRNINTAGTALNDPDGVPDPIAHY